MGKRIEGVKHEQWRKRFAKFEDSELTVAEFCRREEVSEASFYYWAKRIRKSGQVESTRRRRSEVPPSPPVGGVSEDFVEVLVSDSIRVRMPADRLDAVADLVGHLQEICLGAGASMPTSRFQRIQLGTSARQP